MKNRIMKNRIMKNVKKWNDFINENLNLTNYPNLIDNIDISIIIDMIEDNISYMDYGILLAITNDQDKLISEINERLDQSFQEELFFKKVSNYSELKDYIKIHDMSEDDSLRNKLNILIASENTINDNVLDEYIIDIITIKI